MDPSYTLATRDWPRARAASSRSIMVTLKPASSRDTAMPAPIVPPPITPTFWKGRGVAERVSGDWVTACSAN